MDSSSRRIRTWILDWRLCITATLPDHAWRAAASPSARPLRRGHRWHPEPEPLSQRVHRHRVGADDAIILARSHDEVDRPARVLDELDDDRVLVVEQERDRFATRS